MEFNTATAQGCGGSEPTTKGSKVAGAREWREQWEVLSPVLEEMVEEGRMETATALLQWVREWRRVVAEQPVLEERGLWERTLDEIWEAAHASLYGDLRVASRHVEAALHHREAMTASGEA